MMGKNATDYYEHGNLLWNAGDQQAGFKDTAIVSFGKAVSIARAKGKLHTEGGLKYLVMLGLSLFYTGRLDEALPVVEEFVAVSERLGLSNSADHVALTEILAKLLINSAPDRAVTLLESLLGKVSSNDRVFEVLDSLATAHKSGNNLAQAITTAELCREKRLLAGLKFTQLSFSALVNLSVYLLEASNWERAIEVMEEGNEVAVELGLNSGDEYGALLALLVQQLVRTKRFERALTICEEARKHVDQETDTAMGLTQCFVVVLEHFKLFDRAIAELEYYRNRSKSGSLEHASSCHQIGLCYCNLNAYDRAVVELEKGYVIYQRLCPGGLMLAFTCVHLARSLLRCSRARDARTKANTALAILEKFCAKTVKMCGIAVFVTTLVSKEDDEIVENRIGRLCVTMAELAVTEKSVSVAKEWLDQYASLSNIDDEYLVRDKRAIYAQMFATVSSAPKIETAPKIVAAPVAASATPKVVVAPVAAPKVATKVATGPSAAPKVSPVASAAPKSSHVATAVPSASAALSPTCLAWSKLASACRGDMVKLQDYARRFVVSGIRKGTLSEEDIGDLRSQGLPGEICDIGHELLAVKELDPDMFEEELKRLESQAKSLSSSASGRSESTGSVAAGGFPTIQGFRLDRELGRGGQASVYLGVEEATRRTVAIKVMTRRDAATVRLHEQEVHSLLGLRNDNILQVLSWRTEPLLCVITEYAEGGDLRKLLEERNGLDWESDGKRMARLIGEGVAYIHRKNLIHRDLKSENIFLDAKGEPKIGDFGLVKILSGPASGSSLVTGTITTHLGSGVGTPNYMAPEVMQVQFQLASDVWAYGLIVWEILSGRVPFHHLVTKRGQTTEGLFVELVALLDAHRKASKWGLLPVDDEWPSVALDIIQNCTRYDHKDRLTMEKIIEKLKH